MHREREERRRKNELTCMPKHSDPNAESQRRHAKHEENSLDDHTTTRKGRECGENRTRWGSEVCRVILQSRMELSVCVGLNNVSDRE